MQKTINFIPIDYDYFDFNGKNYAKIIGRDEKGKRVCLIDSFEPYFWAVFKENTSEKRIKEIQREIENIKIELESRKTKVEKTSIENKKFLGKDVKAIKIYVTNFKDSHAIADHLNYEEIEARREYDMSFITRYIIEKNMTPFEPKKITGSLIEDNELGGINSIDVDLCIKAEKIENLDNSNINFSPNILAFDIETDEFEIGKGEILMISIYGKSKIISKDGKTENKEIKKVLTWKKTEVKQDFVEYFKTEEDMLEAFVKIIRQSNPDMLVGYFSDGFDMPYLRARADKLGVKLSLGLDNSKPYFSRGRITSSSISGIIHLDLFRFIETVFSQYLQSETLSLNEVALELLGEGKIDFDKTKKAHKRKEEEWNDYFDYNLHDSILTYKLAEKLWPDMFEFSRIIQEPLWDISRSGMSQLVEDYILHNLKNFNEIAEKRPVHEQIEERKTREKYIGAFVLQPQPGLYENLAIFDFTSYWPSIIVTYNLSKSTKLENQEENEEERKNSLEVDLEGKKVYFSKKPGFFPLMLSDIIEKRKKYKQEYKKNENNMTKARSNAYKLLANASYGYQGFFGARYYCPEASAATTSISRDFTKKIINDINKKDYEVIYSDTDSIAFKIENHNKKQVLDMLEQLNKNLPGIMGLELEDFYKRGIWVTKRDGEFGAKKKYALITENNKLKIRGFETVRRDWCDLARELQNNVLLNILKEGNEKSALELVKKTVKELKERKIERNKIVIRTQLKKPLSEYKAITPHVIAAQKIKEKGMPIDLGMLITYFIAETREKKALVRDKVKLEDEKGEYNIEYYLNHQILPAVENIFQIFNINIKEETSGKKQMTLF